ncbi:hypothetical protein Sango_0013300 [Sesamum angolense]|uniref:Retrovirus-related Pol polyprotein from transposon TNT 1-94 n=1 Tax=Sesamum angolense TaxID=2727404 RepID=A0AAE1XCS2_9LAMI|nr:hypothetical protein Sango_0013300 [Sesamum angolense]
MVNQIRGHRDTLEENKIVEEVLRCLPVKFEHIVVAIEESKDLSVLTFDELMGSLEAHERKMRRFAAQDLEQDFQGKVNISHKQDNDMQDKKIMSAQSRGKGRGRHQNYCDRGRGRG